MGLERHTASEMVKIIQELGWEDAIDLVEGGHMLMHKDDAEAHHMRESYNQAEKAGVNLDDVEWYDAAYMERVCYLVLLSFRRSFLSCESDLRILQNSRLFPRVELLATQIRYAFIPSSAYAHSEAIITPTHAHTGHLRHPHRQ